MTGLHDIASLTYIFEQYAYKEFCCKKTILKLVSADLKDRIHKNLSSQIFVISSHERGEANLISCLYFDI